MAMGEKMNIQSLADWLGEKHQMSRKNADGFVRAFFALIEEALEKDKYVKVKGLGTFKLIEVESRESVNVNTGERFWIQGHTKVSFTPEPALKNTINKPFAHFETVLLNENTVFDDVPMESDSEDEESPSLSVTPDTPEEPPVMTPEEPVSVPEESLPVTEEPTIITPEEIVTTPEELQPATEEPSVISSEEPVPASEEPVASLTSSFGDVPVDKEPIVNPPVVETSVAEATALDHSSPSSESSAMKFFLLVLVLLMLLCVGAVAYMYWPDLFDANEVQAREDSVAVQVLSQLDQEELTDQKETGIVTDSLSVSEPVKSEEKPASQPPVQSQPTAPRAPQTESSAVQVSQVLSPSEEYEIAGTLTRHTIKEGETLTKVALRYYGTKALWPYIVKHNPTVIKNPDNVPYGTTVQIPKLVKKMN